MGRMVASGPLAAVHTGKCLTTSTYSLFIRFVYILFDTLGGTQGMFGITTTNTMRYTFEVPGAHRGRASMKWRVTEGGVKELVGQYEFVSLGPSKTKVIYNLFVDPGFPLPEMIKKATNRAIAKSALQVQRNTTHNEFTLRFVR